MGTSYQIKNEQLVECNKDVELLILGNSHAAYGLDPEQFALNAFNLAQVTQSLYFDKRITLKHLNEMKKLKYVLISVDFHSLYFSDEGYRNLWTYYGYGVDYKKEAPILSKWSHAIGYNPKISIEFIKRGLDKKYNRIKAIDVESGVDLSRPIVKGFFAYKDSTDLQKDHLQKRASEFNSMVLPSKERNEIIKDLEDFIDELKKRNIIPILVTLPCYGPYRDLLDKKVQEQNKADILNLCEKYQIQYWDYFTMPLKEDLFFNCDHLNEKGSAYFSAIINTRLESMKYQ
ncbi:MAG TPA: hypothetical protein VF974_07010 [Patescibacteria group bacterium]